MSTVLTINGYNCTAAPVQHEYTTSTVYYSSNTCVNRPCAAMIGRCCLVPPEPQRPVNESSPVPQDLSPKTPMLQLYNSMNSMEMLQMGVTLWSVTLLLHRRACTDNRLDSGMWHVTVDHEGYQLSLDRSLVLPLVLLLLLNQSTFCVYCSTLKPQASPSPRLHPSLPPPTHSYACPSTAHWAFISPRCCPLPLFPFSSFL